MKSVIYYEIGMVVQNLAVEQQVQRYHHYFTICSLGCIILFIIITILGITLRIPYIIGFFTGWSARKKRRKRKRQKKHSRIV